MTLTNPDDHKKKLEDLKIGYSISLNEVLKLMPEYKTNPDDKKLKAAFLKNETNLKNFKNKILGLKNNVEFNSSSVNKNIKKLNNEIKLASEQNKILKEKYDYLISTNNGAKGMLFDTQLLYNQQYIGNLILVCIIFFTAKKLHNAYY
jgi:hypothetical protein